jgi:hypothetical protein
MVMAIEAAAAPVNTARRLIERLESLKVYLPGY